MIKAVTQTGNWWLSDSMRGFNASQEIASATTKYLTANTANSESSYAVELNSQGFKIKTTGTSINQSGDTYIYCAIRAPQKEPVNSAEVFAVNTNSYNSETYINTSFDVDSVWYRRSVNDTNPHEFIAIDKLRGQNRTLYLGDSYIEGDNSSIADLDVNDGYNAELVPTP